jgi:hypothetical protein
MKADNQFQLIPEEMMPFNLAGETLPPPPQEIILCDENHCFCDTLDEYGDSVCKHDTPPTCVSATYLPLNYFTK